jgi:hypothetical protein
MILINKDYFLHLLSLFTVMKVMLFMRTTYGFWSWSISYFTRYGNFTDLILPIALWISFALISITGLVQAVLQIYFFILFLILPFRSAAKIVVYLSDYEDGMLKAFVLIFLWLLAIILSCSVIADNLALFFLVEIKNSKRIKTIITTLKILFKFFELKYTNYNYIIYY